MRAAHRLSNHPDGERSARERLGRHEVLMRLGAGGMATVYLARAIGEGGFERLAALKVLHPHLLGEQEFLAMFLDEARVAARIHHPNVIAIQDLGVDQNRMYTVMDYVLGDTLAAAQQAAIKLRRGLPMGIVLRVILDALRGLDAAHELVDAEGRSLQVVHRDATPHNILLGADGVARVTDFGIAKAESRISFTGVGTLKGKAPYMAPEQFTSRRIDRRADVFSMAVTLWEALALRRCLPPDPTNPMRRPPYRPLIGLVRGVPPALDAVVARGLRLNPDERWRSAGEFADAIEQQLREHIAPHKAVATFVRAFAHDKIERERAAVRSAAPSGRDMSQAVTALRGASGFVSARGTSRAPLVSEALPEDDESLSAAELDPPTRIMSPRKSERPPQTARTLQPTPPSRAPARTADVMSLRPPMRSATLCGFPLPSNAPASDAPRIDSAALESVIPPPEEAFVSITPPSIAPPDLSDVSRPFTVLDPDAQRPSADALDAPQGAPLSLVSPEIPKAPRAPSLDREVARISDRATDGAEDDVSREEGEALSEDEPEALTQGAEEKHEAEPDEEIEDQPEALTQGAEEKHEAGPDEEIEDQPEALAQDAEEKREAEPDEEIEDQPEGPSGDEEAKMNGPLAAQEVLTLDSAAAGPSPTVVAAWNLAFALTVLASTAGLWFVLAQ